MIPVAPDVVRMIKIHAEAELKKSKKIFKLELAKMKKCDIL